MWLPASADFPASLQPSDGERAAVNALAIEAVIVPLPLQELLYRRQDDGVLACRVLASSSHDGQGRGCCRAFNKQRLPVSVLPSSPRRKTRRTCPPGSQTLLRDCQCLLHRKTMQIDAVHAARDASAVLDRRTSSAELPLARLAVELAAVLGPVRSNARVAQGVLGPPGPCGRTVCVVPLGAERGREQHAV